MGKSELHTSRDHAGAADGSFARVDMQASPTGHDVVQFPQPHIPSLIPSGLPSSRVEHLARPFAAPLSRSDSALVQQTSDAAVGEQSEVTVKEPVEPEVRVQQQLADAHRADDPVPTRFLRTRALNILEDAQAAGVFASYRPESPVPANSPLVTDDTVSLYGALVDERLETGKPYSTEQISAVTGANPRSIKRAVAVFKDSAVVASWRRGSGDPINPQRGYVFSDRITGDTHGDEQDGLENPAAGAVGELHERVSQVTGPDDPVELQLYRTLIRNEVDNALAAGLLEPVEPGAEPLVIDPIAERIYADVSRGDLVPGEVYATNRLMARYREDEVPVRNGLGVLRRAGIATMVPFNSENGAYSPGGFTFSDRNIVSDLPDTTETTPAPDAADQQRERVPAPVGEQPKLVVNATLIDFVRDEIDSGFHDPQDIARVYGLYVDQVQAAMSVISSERK